MANEWARGTFTIDNILHTETDILNALENFLTNVSTGWALASWSTGTYGALDRHYLKADRATQPRWQFNGDGPTQFSGIRIFYDADPVTTTGRAEFVGQVHIVVQPFLENQAGSDRQVLTPDFVGTSGTGAAQSLRFGTIRVIYDNTAPNNWLVIGGEDGFYLEAGRDASENNLGHGAIMTFGAIPESNSTQDATVLWTSQGLCCDFHGGSTGGCRFAVNRDRRFVTNDAAQKNFTGTLQPYAARGTRKLDVPDIVDQRAYYIGSRDTFFGAARTGTTNPASTAISYASSAPQQRFDLHATLGLFNSPLSGRYRISPLLMLQSLIELDVGAISASASDVAVQVSLSSVVDPRAWRQIFRFAAVDYTLLPFANVQDSVSGATYRVARMEDNGRFSQFGVVWPSSATTITF